MVGKLFKCASPLLCNFQNHHAMHFPRHHQAPPLLHSADQRLGRSQLPGAAAARGRGRRGQRPAVRGGCGDGGDEPGNWLWKRGVGPKKTNGDGWMDGFVVGHFSLRNFSMYLKGLLDVAFKLWSKMF